MSHFTTLKTVVRDQVVLEDTLRRLHYSYQVGERVPIRGYQGANAYGQVVIDTGSSYDIGFQKQQDESFNVCADWWGVEKDTAIKQERFLQELNRTYSHITVRNQVLDHGYLIEDEKILENGEIELVICERI